MSTKRSLTAALGLGLGLVLVAMTASSPAWAARAERRAQRQAEEQVPPAAIETVRGDRYRLGTVRVARNLTRVRDATGDLLTSAGEPSPEAPAWADISAVYMAPVKLTRKAYRHLADEYPVGSAGTFHGDAADWSTGDRALLVTVELAEPRPRELIAQQVEVGLDGDAAGPVQVGSATDTRAGVESFTLGGRFDNGAEAAGTTDVSGRVAGEPIDYYNIPSRAMGFYDPRQHTYYILLPEQRDARSVSVSLRSTTDDGDVIDRLELPGGGHHVPLSDPGLGFEPAEGTGPVGCRAIWTEARSDGTADGEITGESATTTIRYLAGTGPDPVTGETPDAQELLAALDRLETIPMRLDRLDEEADPLTVQARVTRASALGSFSLSMDVPPGQWSFTPADGQALVTPAGEALIDHLTLTGRAGVRTGEGLVGFVSGDPDCGRWDLGVEACELVPGAEMEALVPTDGSGLEQADIAQADGTAWCVGRVPGTRDAKYIVRIGRDYATAAEVEAAAEASGCTAAPVELGSAGFALDCAEQGAFERFVFLVTPQMTADQDAAGGILVSLDMVVDPARPFGERYDSAAATALFSGIAADLAASASPGGATGTGTTGGLELP